MDRGGPRLVSCFVFSFFFSFFFFFFFSNPDQLIIHNILSKQQDLITISVLKNKIIFRQYLKFFIFISNLSFGDLQKLYIKLHDRNFYYNAMLQFHISILIFYNAYKQPHQENCSLKFQPEQTNQKVQETLPKIIYTKLLSNPRV
eukprot:TRINITY_DN8243_c1_g3_i1.p1 TRINITY_DN8243_c1_g3~~TRINITY_DN8243_c1_g3_i1.p1  ORF type:complete len:165 (+),score=9.27 TRINITY_DN8243_c1_g3_i1:63-497(+)